MRHIQTPAGEVHTLRFAPDGDSVYFVSKEPYGMRLSGADDLNQTNDIPGFPGLGLPNVSEMLDSMAGLLNDTGFGLYQRAMRVDVRSGRIVREWSFSGSEVAIFTPDFRSLYHSVSVAVAGGELDLRRLDLVTGDHPQVYDADVPYPSRLAFTPNGHILAIAGSHYAGDSEYRVHRLDVWHRTELDPLNVHASALAYSPDGSLLATGGMGGVRVWRGKAVIGHWLEPEASALAWSADGLLAWAGKDRLAVVLPGADAGVRAWPVSDMGPWSVAVAFAPDGRRVLIGGQRGCAIHDIVAGREQTMFDWGIGRIHSVAFAPDGLTCVAGGEKGRVVVWDAE